MKKFTLILVVLFAGVFSSKNLNAQVTNNFLWSKAYGGIGLDRASVVGTDDSCNVYVCGYFNPPSINIGKYTFNTKNNLNKVLIKYDSKGNIKWVQNCGGDQMIVKPNGDIYLIGRTADTLHFGTYNYFPTGSTDKIYIAKLNSNGNFMWLKDYIHFFGFGGAMFKLAVDYSDNVYVAGLYIQEVDFGTVKFTRSGSIHFFVAKYDKNGNFMWANDFGNFANEEKIDITFDTQNNVYITGSFGDYNLTIGSKTYTNKGNNRDIYLVKYNNSGSLAWSKTFGGTENDIIYSLVADTLNNFYIIGNSKSPSINSGNLNLAINTNSFVVRFDSTGKDNYITNCTLSVANNCKFFIFKNQLHYFGFGGNLNYTDLGLTSIYKSYNILSGNDKTYVSATIDKNNNFLALGEFNGLQLIFGNDTLNRVRDYDFFVTKFSSNIFTSIYNDESIISNSNLSIYPNPAKDKLIVTAEGKAEVKVFDIRGQLKYSRLFNENDVINLSNYSKGIYIIQITSDNKIYNSKFIKE